jgi:hypothetical protein
VDFPTVRPVVVASAPVGLLPYSVVDIDDTFSCDPQPPSLRGDSLRHEGARGRSRPLAVERRDPPMFHNDIEYVGVRYRDRKHSNYDKHRGGIMASQKREPA